MRPIRAVVPRFIPTGVGRACVIPKRFRAAAVHPHGCGACCNDELVGYFRYGSSPRVWGVLAPRVDHRLVVRFIPTGVGRARWVAFARRLFPVHPHGCGACNLCGYDVLYSTGSSPRVWGVLNLRISRIRAWRFIPTGVGRALSAVARGGTSTVHPHGCGACAVRRLPVATRAGSSPRVWGVRDTLRREGGVSRFIPTGVGRALALPAAATAFRFIPTGVGRA